MNQEKILLESNNEEYNAEEYAKYCNVCVVLDEMSNWLSGEMDIIISSIKLNNSMPEENFFELLAVCIKEL